MKIAITVDTENDLGFLDTHYGIDEGLPVILDAFGKHNVKATFFVSGQAAEYLYARGWFKDIANGSHEVASHGFIHADYRTWEYTRIREEVCRSRKVLEEYSGKPVKGYRAPQFLLNEKVVRAVKECGFVYDSSLPDISGISAAKLLRGVSANKSLQDVLQASGMGEFPIDSIPVVRLPHGLLWVNLLSLGIYRRLFAFQKDKFAVFYLHPFDIIKNKSRINLDIKRKLFYLRNENSIDDLLSSLIEFWISEGVAFTTLEEACN